MGEFNELLNRQYSSGTIVTNCVVHMDMKLTERPDDCKLCLSDLRNSFNRAIAVNQWLNTWKDDATELLEIVVRMSELGNFVRHD